MSGEVVPENKHLYFETIDPDNESHAQNCIDYDPYPIGSGIESDDNNEIKEFKGTPIEKSFKKSVNTMESPGGKSLNSDKILSTKSFSPSTDNSVLSFQKSYIQSFPAHTQKNIENDNQKSVKRLRVSSSSSTSSENHGRQTDINSSANNTMNPSDQWHTVGFFSSLNTRVTDYIPYSLWSTTNLTERITSDNIPNISNISRVKLEPGTAYRFRLRAINSFGMGEPGESASFKTSLPGFPGAPSSIKISKSTEGAHLVWQPPLTNSNEKLEFTVYLAIKSPKREDNEMTQGQLAFIRVYSGFNNQCLVSNATLATAHVDYSAKPAIIFRIAAKNNKGYGPATQVRWLQDSSLPTGVTAEQSNQMKLTTKMVKRK